MSADTRQGTSKQLFIGGEWGGAEGWRTFEDRDPFNGDLVAEVAAASRADAKRAIDAAAAAAPAWAQTPPAVRQGIFLKAAEVLESRQDEIVSLLARETGATFGFSMFQMHFVPGLFRQAAALAYAPIGEVIPSDTGVFSSMSRQASAKASSLNSPASASRKSSASALSSSDSGSGFMGLKWSFWSDAGRDY